MKTITLLLSLLLPVCLAAAPTSSPEKVSASVSSEPPVIVELFSIYCRACFSWDQHNIPELKKKLKEYDIGFRQAHSSSFGGKYSTQISTVLAMLEGTPRYDPVKKALFERIHLEHKGDWKSDTEFFATLKKAGVTEQEYQNEKHGPVTLKTLADWGTSSDLTDSIPSFLLNGKYKISAKGVKSMDEFVERIKQAIKSRQ